MSIEERVRELNGGTYTKKSYSVEEVQAILGITRQTVYKLIKQVVSGSNARNRIPHYKVQAL